jgi:hypothetical protein
MRREPVADYLIEGVVIVSIVVSELESRAIERYVEDIIIPY